MLSLAVVIPGPPQAIETALSLPLTMNVPVIAPEVEPMIRATATDPPMDPWAWKSLLVTARLKLSTVEMGVSECEGFGQGVSVGEGFGQGVNVGEGVGGAVRVGTAKNAPGLGPPLVVGAPPLQAATNARITTTAAQASPGMPKNGGWCLTTGIGMAASYARLARDGRIRPSIALAAGARLVVRCELSSGRCRTRPPCAGASAWRERSAPVVRRPDKRAMRALVHPGRRERSAARAGAKGDSHQAPLAPVRPGDARRSLGLPRVALGARRPRPSVVARASRSRGEARRLLGGRPAICRRRMGARR